MKVAIFLLESAYESTSTLFTTMEAFAHSEETWGLRANDMYELKQAVHQMLMGLGVHVWIIAGQGTRDMLAQLDDHYAEHKPAGYIPLISNSTSAEVQLAIYNHVLKKDMLYRCHFTHMPSFSPETPRYQHYGHTSNKPILFS